MPFKPPRGSYRSRSARKMGTRTPCGCWSWMGWHALPGNTHLAHLLAEPCGCGTCGGEVEQHTTPRWHHFSNCPVARSVHQQIETLMAGPV